MSGGTAQRTHVCFEKPSRPRYVITKMVDVHYSVSDLETCSKILAQLVLFVLFQDSLVT